MKGIRIVLVFVVVLFQRNLEGQSTWFKHRGYVHAGVGLSPLGLVPMFNNPSGRSVTRAAIPIDLNLGTGYKISGRGLLIFVDTKVVCH